MSLRLAARVTGNHGFGARLGSLQFARGARTRAVPAKPTAARRHRFPASSFAASSTTPTQSSGTIAARQNKDVSKAEPFRKQAVYVELSHLIPPAAHAEPQVVELSSAVFDEPSRRDILHLCLMHFRDSQRQGSANTKTRGEVRGSGRKIRPQKGTGKARLGDGQSPMLVGGGRAFGPKPRDFSTDLPRKVRAMGMRVALSARVRERGLIVVDNLAWPGTKTKEFAHRLRELSWGKCLFVTGRGDDVIKQLERVGSNVEGFRVIKVEDLNIHEILRYQRLAMDVDAAQYLETKWQASSWFNSSTAPPIVPEVPERLQAFIASKQFAAGQLKTFPAHL
ncbi:ribosomal protein L4 domain-containing protein [Auriculariales sp. MPI-PUGE-AT-0066]|nr:ribosomal protein L4 domain-containing protein [Auriculariales sp. MPI-PUGE-AT-0066]